MFTEREIEILKKLYHNETTYIFYITYDINEIENLRKLVSGAIEYVDGKRVRLTPVGRDSVSEILRIQND